MTKLIAVITRIRNGVVDYCVTTQDARKAEKLFLEQIRGEVINFDKRNDSEDIEDILTDGYYEFDHNDKLHFPCESGSICLTWAVSE